MNLPPVYLWVVGGAFLLSLGVTGVLYLAALKAELLPSIRQRDVHTVRKPRVGGVAMWLSIMLMLTVLYFSPWPQLLNFQAGQIFGLDRALVGIGAGMIVIMITGLLDDLYNLSAGWQLVGQSLAACALVAAGVGISNVHLPFGLSLSLDQFSFAAGSFLVHPLAIIFTLLWVMTMMNVMNFFDGLDGLAGSVAFTASTVLFFLSLRVGYATIAPATISAVVAGTTAGFLPWNWHPSKLFMGTVGSQMLGFLLGTIAIVSGGKLATAVLVLGIPLFDAVIVVVRRLLVGANPFQADQRHLHHRLTKMGLNVPWVVIVINLVTVVFGVLAYRSQESTYKGLLTLILALLMGIFIAITYLAERKSMVVKKLVE